MNVITYIARIFDIDLDDDCKVAEFAIDQTSVESALLQLRERGGNCQLIIQTIKNGSPWVFESATPNALVVLARQVATGEKLQDQVDRIQEMFAEARFC